MQTIDKFIQPFNNENILIIGFALAANVFSFVPFPASGSNAGLSVTTK